MIKMTTIGSTIMKNSAVRSRTTRREADAEDGEDAHDVDRPSSEEGGQEADHQAESEDGEDRRRRRRGVRPRWWTDR